MIRQTGGVLILAVIAVTMAGCGRQGKTEPAQPDEVVLKVPGMH